MEISSTFKWIHFNWRICGCLLLLFGAVYVDVWISIGAKNLAVESFSETHSPESSDQNRHIVIWPKHLSENVNVNSYTDTTGPQIPVLLHKRIASTQPIDEDMIDFNALEIPVSRLEVECGWENVTKLTNKSCLLGDVPFNRHSPIPVQKIIPPSEIHIVVAASGDLDFLNEWKEFFEGYEFIFIQEGDPNKVLKIPEWVNYRLYNQYDIEKIIGSARAWIFDSNDSSIQGFGFLVSNRKYIYTLGYECIPATRQDAGMARSIKINALSAHLKNLHTPSTPFFFNTLYDPYEIGSDFVRGYPYSLRAGVPTVISHGIWLGHPDYDAPTQVLKAREQNQRLVDATHTIPFGSLFPLSSINVAFDREIIGVAFMQGLMGAGQPWSRYGDMFAGWASKVCADHLGFGVKSGYPYVQHIKAPVPFVNLKKEYKGLFWQEELIKFMHTVHIDTTATDAESCYLDLAKKIQTGFDNKHPYFKRLTTAMEIWVELWRSASNGTLIFPPSQQSSQQVELNRNKDKTAVFTMVRSNKFMLNLWLKYYRQHFSDEDIYVIDNSSDDGGTFALPVEVITIRTEIFGDNAWIRDTVRDLISKFLDLGYHRVIFTDVDEFIVADPKQYPGGLREYLMANPEKEARTTGYDLITNRQLEQKFNPNLPVMSQRLWYARIGAYDKPLLVKRPVNYQVGFHNCAEHIERDDNLLLFHMKLFDYDSFMAQQQYQASQKWNEADVQQGWGSHNRLRGEELERFFKDHEDLSHREEIPVQFRIPPAF